MKESKALHKLQQLVLPTPELSVPEHLYWQPKTNVVYHAAERSLEFLPGGKLSLQSFFNAFPVHQWCLSTANDEIYLSVEGSGRIILEVYSGAYGNDSLLVSELVELSESEPVTLRIPGVQGDPHADPKLIYATFFAPEGATLTEACYLTATPPRHKVRAGLSITHFKREAWVLPAIKRIRKELLADPDMAPLLHLYVVDNSQSLSLEPHPGITHVPNRNLGGAGGFARGLLECELAGEFTHCLFLDDDATMELESVRRAIRAAQYAPPDTAITGTLFYGDRRSLVHEVGAMYRVFPLPIMMGLDMRDPGNIDRFVQEYNAPDYGGWWFFLFPIKHVTNYPFPYFVRGDDIAFGVTNKFRIKPLLGVACWAEDFASKDSPWLRYLDLRSITRLPLIADTCKPKHLIEGLRNCINDLLLTYRYDSAEAGLLGMNHALADADFWRDNLDVGSLRSQHKSLFSAESFKPIAEVEESTGRQWRGIPSPRGPFKQSKWRKFIRFITLNGNLLPRSILSKSPAVLVKDLCAPPYLVYPHPEILYVRRQDACVMLAARNVWRGARLWLKATMLLGSLKFGYRNWQKKAQGVYASLASKDFWLSVYYPEKLSPGPAPATVENHP